MKNHKKGLLFRSVNEGKVLTYGFRIAHFDLNEHNEALKEGDSAENPIEGIIGESPPENSMFYLRLRLFESCENDVHKQIGAIIRELIAKQEFTFSRELWQDTLGMTSNRAYDMCVALINAELAVKAGQNGRILIYRLTVSDYPAIPAPGQIMLDLLHDITDHPQSTRDSRIGTFLLSRIAANQLCFTTAEWMTDAGISQTAAVADIRRALNKGLVRKYQMKSIGTLCFYLINAEPQTEISLNNIIPRNREYITRLFNEFGIEPFSVEQCAELLGITSSSAYFNLSNFKECGVMDCQLNPGKANSYRFKITPDDHPECFETASPATKSPRRTISQSYPMVAASA